MLTDINPRRRREVLRVRQASSQSHLIRTRKNGPSHQSVEPVRPEATFPAGGQSRIEEVAQLSSAEGVWIDAP